MTNQLIIISQVPSAWCLKRYGHSQSIGQIWAYTKHIYNCLFWWHDQLLCVTVKMNYYENLISSGVLLLRQLQFQRFQSIINFNPKYSMRIDTAYKGKYASTT
ncbi:Hypothetical_protein [Hexamita inflata]|uniref:Hypothetical_protein n=1 Tax=Hexamita inflata TaxID=28002 RepID=A0ABP1IA53_9EUKA